MVSKLQCELLEEGAWSQNFSVNCWRRGMVLKLQCELLEEGRGLKTSV